MLQEAEIKIEALTTDLENLKQSRVTTQHEVEQNADLQIQKILNSFNTMIGGDEARLREKLRKRQSSWTTLLNKYSGRVQSLEGETQSFDEQAKAYQRKEFAHDCFSEPRSHFPAGPLSAPCGISRRP